jgi:hypothetical protein
MNTYVIQVFENRAVGAILLENFLGLLLHVLQLDLGLTDNPVKGTLVGGGSTLVEKVNIDVVGNGELAGSNGLEDSGLSTTVLTEETVATTEGQLEGGVGNKDFSVEHKRGRGDLNVARGGKRGQHTGGDTIGETVLIHLSSELVDDTLILGGRGILDDGVSMSIEFDFLGLLGLFLVGTLGHAGSLRGGNHGCGCDGIKEIKKIQKSKEERGRKEMRKSATEIEEKFKKA